MGKNVHEVLKNRFTIHGHNCILSYNKKYLILLQNTEIFVTFLMTLGNYLLLFLGLFFWKHITTQNHIIVHINSNTVNDQL